MRRLLTRLRQEDGFSLTELMVVMPLLGILLAAITGVLITLMAGNSKTTGQLTQQSSFFPIFDGVVRDLRTAMPPAIGGLALLSATSTTVTFYSPDGLAATSGPTSPFHLREVAYRFSGGGLQRQTVASTNTYATVTSTTPWGSWTSAKGNFPLATFPTSTGWRTVLGTGVTTDSSSPSITSGTFTYYDANGNIIDSPVSAANIVLVRTIQLAVTATVPGSPAQLTTYNNTATIRETQPTQ
jgi:prepilin-type N-terminal cleavage/methylation domain-containing protein